MTVDIHPQYEVLIHHYLHLRQPSVRFALSYSLLPQGGGESKRTGHFASEDALSEKNIPSRIKSNEHEDLHLIKVDEYYLIRNRKHYIHSSTCKKI